MIIYDNTRPIPFSEEDFVIVFPESVYGIGKVKSKITSGMITETIVNANDNGRIIERIYLMEFSVMKQGLVSQIIDR